MPIADYIKAIPKAELHVHLEGAVQPELLLTLAKRHNIELPASDVEGVRKWYTFRDFPHFVEIYVKISQCMQTPEDIETVARAFIDGQAAQNIRYTEATYTAYTHYWQKGIPFDEQLDALTRAREWGRKERGTLVNWIIDIPRNLADTPEASMQTAEWAVSGMGSGVVALGLGGQEDGYPPEKFIEAFAYARQHGLASIPHAGEHVGPESIWGAIESLGAERIGHGVRAVEDPELLAFLRESQLPIEVSPTSNVCLGVVPTFEAHMLPQLLDAGVYVTLNSDDPPMFNTTLTDEFTLAAAAFGWDADTIERLTLNAVNAAVISKMQKALLEASFQTEFARARAAHL